MQELKVRFYAEHVWTGFNFDVEQLMSEEDLSPAHLTSNPVRVQALMKRLKTLRDEERQLKRNVAFRPTPSQVVLYS